ncbi:MAG TPA: type II toxin-antitoxin system RelE/ParE family toxin [Acidobacteriaceae bacterium]|nr:type II toxin-antitoxin system RelE/ParE family toxin [Acidobacteriaceae bacterium]
MAVLKRVKFLGDSLEALKHFPEKAQKRAGYQLELVQSGLDPADWKPMTSVGPGVREIRVRDEQGIFRVMYVAKFQRAVYVLHCFQKKTQKTDTADIELAQRRYKELEKEQLQ